MRAVFRDRFQIQALWNDEQGVTFGNDGCCHPRMLVSRVLDSRYKHSGMTSKGLPSGMTGWEVLGMTRLSSPSNVFIEGLGFPIKDFGNDGKYR